MKLASGFCIPEPLPVHTDIKRRQVHPLIRFLLRSRVDEKCADLHQPFISYFFLVRAVDNASSLTAVPATAVGQARTSPHGQHSGCLVYQLVWRYTITPYVTARPPSPLLESHAVQITVRCPHPGEAQSCSRRTLTTAYVPRRMATPSRDDLADLESTRGSSGEPVCFPRFLPPPAVFFPDRGPPRHGRTGTQLASGFTQVCVSPSEPTRTDNVQAQGGRGAGPAGCAALAHPDLVSRTNFPRDSNSLAHFSEKGQWIVDAVSLAYQSQGKPCPLGVRAHSTRSVVSSHALAHSASLADICRAAGWATPNTFARFYSLCLEPVTSCVLGNNNVVMQRRGVGLDGTEGSAFWGILAELPGSQTGLARGAWGGTASPNSTALAAGKMGRGRERGSRASHTVVPWTWEPGGKGNCSFFE